MRDANNKWVFLSNIIQQYKTNWKSRLTIRLLIIGLYPCFCALTIQSTINEDFIVCSGPIIPIKLRDLIPFFNDPERILFKYKNNRNGKNWKNKSQGTCY